MKKLCSIMSNLQLTHYHFKHDFRKLDQHTRDKCLIYGTKYHNDNQFQNLELPCSKESKYDIKSPHLQNQNYIKKSLNVIQN